MGAWGSGSFDNDDAADWLAELEERSGVAFLRSALRPRWVDHLYLQAPKGSVIVAAAEVLAAGLGNAAPDLPAEALEWVRANSGLPYSSLKGTARSGLGRVLGGRSELRSLWADNPTEGEVWARSVQDLLRRVG